LDDGGGLRRALERRGPRCIEGNPGEAVGDRFSLANSARAEPPVGEAVLSVELLSVSNQV